MLLFSFCDCCWVWPWLLPFLLGALLGWLLRGRGTDTDSVSTDHSAELSRLRAQNKTLQDNLEYCRSKRTELDGQLALLKGRVREMEDDTSTNLGLAASAPASPAPSISANKFAALKSDNLQVVEGIGPKMDSILKDNGVDTWRTLEQKGTNGVQSILNSFGDKYRIIDPSTWSQQAGLAADGKWDELIQLQKNLDGGRSDTAKGVTDSKVEKIMVKLGILKKWKQDDLKAVEGIGPKIEQLLHADGIKTWKALSDASVTRLQGILDKAGKRYQLADPGTWPQQAGLAAAGKWDELEKLQDELDGGK